MKKFILFCFLNSLLNFSVILFAYADTNPPAITEPIPISQITEYSTYSPIVKELIIKSFYLTKMNLTYLYGSADPKNKGMDCSGTIYYLLNQFKINPVPRSANDMFNWVEKQGKLHRITHANFNSAEFSNLKPGDLLFWSGTYRAHQPSLITHVMLYLGKDKTGRRLMFGASNGRTYLGKKMWGVSVFDFNLPDSTSEARFIGYSCIPNLTCKS